jgi:exodeoxyribonuclease-3
MEKLKLVSWNVNGLRAVHKKGFLEWFEKENPDILCLQETKASEDQLVDGLRNPSGYKAYFASAEKKGYSGVAIFTNKEPVKVKKGFGIKKFDNEGRVLVADYEKFVLMNIYYPNGKASPERLKYKLDFYDAFLEYAEGLRAKGKNLVICGDVNTAHKEIDLAHPKENETVSGFLPVEREWMDKFFGCGYVDTFREFNKEPEQYTWWHVITRARERNIGWRIDYFFVNEEFRHNVKSAFIQPEVMGSDHCPIGIEITL